MAENTIKEIKDALGFTNTSEFMAEWKTLSDEDKQWFKDQPI